MRVNRDKSLKSENYWKIGIFILIHILLFWSFIVSKGFGDQSIFKTSSSITLKNSLIGVIVPLLAVIANGILSVHFKSILVFWRIKNPLPGSRAFTKFVFKDPRINTKKLKRILGDFPSSPKEQNIEWYRIYKKHKNKPAILDSHQVYLLSRDLTGLGFILLIVFVLSFIFIKNPPTSECVYTGALFLQYIVLSTVSRNYGNRFVCNVLAEETS